ncbi:MAG TPA: oxidoreductase [Myxococcota bacterium]|nr:oxidoreductase [Myxococcota bacterium]
MNGKPKLAVFKFASCDGCQVSLLNLEQELLALAERIDVAFFLEATSHVDAGPYDVALVEGSITTEEDVARIQRVRAASRTLVTIGVCATSGGIQALRNTADVEAWKRQVYPHPEWVHALATSTPISEHVKVDAEIQGCPVDKHQVLRVLLRALLGAAADLPGASVCMECKRRGLVCVLVAKGSPCLGPITRAGCGALCPSLGRDCYACFGPADDPNPTSLADRLERLGVHRRDVVLRLRGVAGWRPEFRAVADRLEGGRD